MMISHVTKTLLALSGLKGVGPASLLKAAQDLPKSASIHRSDLEAMLSGIKSQRLSPESWSHLISQAEFQIESAIKLKARIISVLDDEYPSLLKQTKDRPFFLYIRGALTNTPRRSVAIIGTRKPTAHGEEVTSRISRYFSTSGWSVVSGLALGCDSIAHKAAIESRGHTVAVLAHGLHTVAPKSNAKLAMEILESGGALVSEYGFDVEPSRFNFVKRDRIQAGLSAGVIMVQSDLIGGSLHASRAAIEYERTLAVPHPTDRDIQSLEPKIEANLLLSDGDLQKKCNLLKCNPPALRNLFVVRSKADYERLSLLMTEGITSEAPAQSDDNQRSLL